MKLVIVPLADALNKCYSKDIYKHQIYDIKKNFVTQFYLRCKTCCVYSIENNRLNNYLTSNGLHQLCLWSSADSMK